MREYETTVIVQPEISDEGSAAILQKMDAILAEGGSTRLMCSDLGKRKLAYEVKKFQKGHYYILSFLDEGKTIPVLERSLRMEESVLRFMTVQVDDSVTDIEARAERARELEIEQKKRAAEKAAREAEEAAARAEVERQALEAAAQEEAQADAGASEDAASDDPFDASEAEAEESGSAVETEPEFAEDEETDDEDGEKS